MGGSYNKDPPCDASIDAAYGVGPFLMLCRQMKFLPCLKHWTKAPLTPQITSAYLHRYQLGSAKPTHGPLSLTPPVRCILAR
eukprot:9651633-Ditylum_brightwellii.AAC.1